MIRLNLVLGAAAAVAIGTVGGWSLVWAPSRHAPAVASISTARVQTTTAAPSAGEADPSARMPAPTTTPNPAPDAPPSHTVEAPPSRTTEVPPVAAAAPVPTPAAAPADQPRDRPYLRLDGDRTELGFEGERGGFNINKERLSLGTPLGKFELKW